MKLLHLLGFTVELDFGSQTSVTTVTFRYFIYFLDISQMVLAFKEAAGKSIRND